MMNAATFVDLDVHARSIKAVALDVMTGEVKAARFGYDHAAVASRVAALPQPAKCVYESGVTRFDLAKKLAGDGIDCAVDAVSKMIRPAADRGRKSDRNDAEFLARILSAGNVVEVWVPDDGCKAARNLSRALEEVARAKQLPSKFLLRHGFAFDERTLTGQRRKNRAAAHWAWMRSISFEQKAAADAFAYYVDRVRSTSEEKADALRAFERRERAAGRDNEGEQPPSEEGARGIGLALPDVLTRHEGPRSRSGSRHARQKACGEGCEEARRKAGGHGRPRTPQEQGQRRHGPGVRVLGLGPRRDGRVRPGRRGA